MSAKQTTTTFIASALRAALDNEAMSRDDVVNMHAVLLDAVTYLSMTEVEKGSKLLGQKADVLGSLVEEIEKKFTDCNLEI